MQRIVISLVLGSLMIAATALPCSVFSVIDAEGSPKVGRNLDWIEGSVAWAQIVPATSKGFGAILFGCDLDVWPQGGMNDQGLVLGMTATPFLEIADAPDREPMGWDFWESLFSSCATVDEVLAFLARYDLGSVPGYFEQGQMLWTDATGDSAIVEGDMIYRRGDDPFQVMTNFLHSHPWLGGYPCPRYTLLQQRLGSSSAVLDDEELVDIIEAAHGTLWGGYTVWSLLYDPLQLEVTVFYQGDFTRPVVLDLGEDLALGTRGWDLDLLFDRCPGDREPTTIPAATELVGCTTISAAFDCAGDRDVWQLTPPADGEYTITVLSQLQPSVSVRGPRHSEMANSADGQVTVSLQAGTIVSIHLAEATGQIGAYQVVIDGCQSTDGVRKPRSAAGRGSTTPTEAQTSDTPAQRSAAATIRSSMVVRSAMPPPARPR